MSTADIPTPESGEVCDRPLCALDDDRCTSMVVATLGHGSCPYKRPEPIRHNHDAVGVYSNCPACGTVLPEIATPSGGEG